MAIAIQQNQKFHKTKFLFVHLVTIKTILNKLTDCIHIKTVLLFVLSFLCANCKAQQPAFFVFG